MLTVLLSLHHGLDVCIGVADANSGTEPFPRFSHWACNWMQLAFFYWFLVILLLGCCKCDSKLMTGRLLPPHRKPRRTTKSAWTNWTKFEQRITKNRKGSQHILSSSNSHPLRTRPRRESASVLQLCPTPKSFEHRAEQFETYKDISEIQSWKHQKNILINFTDWYYEITDQLLVISSLHFTSVLRAT